MASGPANDAMSSQYGLTERTDRRWHIGNSAPEAKAAHASQANAGQTHGAK
ncbi:MAG TPA: hypothetical protein VFK80_00550 [Limnochordia bacterium]|nr:hypothetical protein [Limnochordia bacterium]